MNRRELLIVVRRALRRLAQLVMLAPLLLLDPGCGAELGLSDEEDPSTYETQSSLPGGTATLLFNDGFESGVAGKYAPDTTAGGTFTVATSPVASGSYSGKFDLAYAPTGDTYRAEATLAGGTGRLQFGKEYWLGLRYRYENWEADTDMESAPFQVHTKPSTWADNCPLGSAYTTAPVFMVAQNNEARIMTYGKHVLWHGPLQRHQWLQLVVHLRPSKTSNGFVEVWKNGLKLGRVEGANSPELDDCGEPMESPYVKLGIYKWNWQRKATGSARRTLYLDNVKLASGPNGYGLVGGQ